MPMSMETAIPPSIAKVVAAFFDFGSRKDGTPLEMASTPVSAAQPEEKVRAMRMTKAIPTRPVYFGAPTAV